MAENMPPSFPPQDVSQRSTEISVNPEDAQDIAEVEENEAKRSKLRSLLETIAIVACALLVAVVIKTFLVQAFWVPSGSMESTLMPGDRIAVNRLADTPEEIHRGDVVVFVDPGGWLTEAADTSLLSGALQKVGILPEDAGQHLVKRVIGVGGDTVECCTINGKLKVNGTEITETYLDDGTAPSQLEFKVTVPEGSVWVMGDNRSNSRDSRYHMSDSTRGFVPVDNIVGRAWLKFYPFSRFGKIADASDVFADVK